MNDEIRGRISEPMHRLVDFRFLKILSTDFGCPVRIRAFLDSSEAA